MLHEPLVILLMQFYAGHSNSNTTWLMYNSHKSRCLLSLFASWACNPSNKNKFNQQMNIDRNSFQLRSKRFTLVAVHFVVVWYCLERRKQTQRWFFTPTTPSSALYLFTRCNRMYKCTSNKSLRSLFSLSIQALFCFIRSHNFFSCNISAMNLYFHTESWKIPENRDLHNFRSWIQYIGRLAWI